MNYYPNEILLGVSPTIYVVNVNSSESDVPDSRGSSAPFNRLLNGMSSPTAINTSHKGSGSGSGKGNSSGGGGASEDPFQYWSRSRVKVIGCDHEFPMDRSLRAKNSKKQKLHTLSQQINSGSSKDYHAKALEGILPSCWVEKHTKVLPSVLLVVFEISTDELLEFEANEMSVVDTQTTGGEAGTQMKVRGQMLVKKISDTVSRMKKSIVSEKRETKIYFICLVTGSSEYESDADSAIKSVRVEPGFFLNNGFLHAVCNSCKINSQFLSVFHSHALDVPVLESEAMKSLRLLLKNVREASMSYYLTAARRAKRKERDVSNKMIGTSTSSFLVGDSAVDKEYLSLIVRYNFKTAIFYEFVGSKQEKCLKHYADAYLALENYYRHIVENVPNYKNRNTPNYTIDSPSMLNKDSSESGFEVSLASPVKDRKGITGRSNRTRISMNSEDGGQFRNENAPKRSENMAFQCLYVADWLNLKLIRLGLGKSIAVQKHQNPKKLATVAAQWRRHCRMFLNSMHGCDHAGDVLRRPKWFHISYVAHQRLLMSQLTERNQYEPKENDSSSSDIEYYCSPSRHYLAAAETTLILHNELKLRFVRNEEKIDVIAPSFVGGLAQPNILDQLKAEKEKDHLSLALDYVQRALQLFKDESSRPKQKMATARSNIRMLFIAGKIAMMKEKFDLAATYLQNAFIDSSEWIPVKVSVGKVLIECLTRLGDVPLRSRVVSDLLFNSRAQQFMSQEDINELCTYFFEESLRSDPLILPQSGVCPFSFKVTFPNRSYAEVGDNIDIELELKSHLCRPFYLFGFEISFDFDTARSFVPDCGIVLVPGKPFKLQAKFRLPAQDQSEPLSHRSIASRVRVRPYSSGLTYAGGCVVTSRNQSTEGPMTQENRMGGVPTSCSGIKLCLSYESECKSKSKDIILLANGVENARFEKDDNVFNGMRSEYMSSSGRNENDYLVSTWNNGNSFPISSGPCCLRVLDPLAFLEITDLTTARTMNTGFIGGIYRVVLKVTAGTSEWCSNLSISVKTNSFLLASEGNDGVKRDEEVVAFLVEQSEEPNLLEVVETNNLSRLPMGWRKCRDDSTLVVESLAEKESILVHFDLYMPSRRDAAVIDGNIILKTDFTTTFSYEQHRHRIDNFNVGKMVSCQHYGHLVWKDPLRAKYDISNVPQSNFHNGCIRPGNFISDVGSENPEGNTDDSLSLHFQSGQMLGCKMVLYPFLPNLGIDLLISDIRVKTVTNNSSPATASVYESESQLCTNEDGHLLQGDAQLALSYIVHLENSCQSEESEYLKVNLGLSTIKWKPSELKLPSGEGLSLSKQLSNDKTFAKLHGPLPICSYLSLLGPLVGVHRSPFRVNVSSCPVSTNLSTPFTVEYSVVNETKQHQLLNIDITESKSLLFSGLEKFQFQMAPYEKYTFGYTAIALTTGDVELPSLHVSSYRHKTWIINEKDSDRRTIFVLP